MAQANGRDGVSTGEAMSATGEPSRGAPPAFDDHCVRCITVTHCSARGECLAETTAEIIDREAAQHEIAQLTNALEKRGEHLRAMSASEFELRQKCDAAERKLAELEKEITALRKGF